MAIGVKSDKPQLRSILAQAQERAVKLERLRLSAHHFAETTRQGQRRRHRYGRGENFWQFRPYQAGEEAAAIDWRRSARDTHLYIRDKEQETAQTLYLVPDFSNSMLYRSRMASISKEERTLFLLFILAELAAKNGDKVGVPNLLAPRLDRAVSETIGAALLNAKNYPAQSGFAADFSDIPRFAHVVILSDFLEDWAKLEKILTIMAEKETCLSLVVIADPAEVNFPYSGDILFQDPETGKKLHFGQAQTLRADYQVIYRQRQQKLEQLAARIHAHLIFDITNNPPEKLSKQLLTLLEHA